MENENIFHIDIERETIDNTNYRKVLFTTDNQQLVVMNIKPNDDIPLEIHPLNDQFIRIEEGIGKLFIGKSEEISYDLMDGISVIIPANTWHRVVNTSNTKNLKLYTIYSPPHHNIGRIDIEKPEQEKKTNFSRNQSGGTCNIVISPKKYINSYGNRSLKTRFAMYRMLMGSMY